MTAVTVTARTGAPVATAWRELTDWAGQGRWMPFTAVEVVAGDAADGTRLVARTGIGPLAVVDDMVVDVWDPPRRCEVAHLGRLIRGRGIFTVEALAGGGAEISWTEQLQGLPARLTAPFTRMGLQVALRRLARLAERA